jgi:hypothetical protein
MLTIRASQLGALRAVPRRVFEDEMVRHLARYAPRHCQVIGDASVRDGIRLGIERAAHYELTARGPVRFYIESMFMFGSDFDTDPQVPWAGEVLSTPYLDQMAKASRLYERAMDYVDRTAGADYVHAKEALHRLRRQRFDDAPPPDDRFVDAMYAKLQEIHPQKLDYLGETSTRALIAAGARLPSRLSMQPGRGAALCVGAMFALGHGFGSDPLLPWIQRTVTNPGFSPEARVARLHSRMMTYLDRVLADQDGAEAPVP